MRTTMTTSKFPFLQIVFSDETCLPQKAKLYVVVSEENDEFVAHEVSAVLYYVMTSDQTRREAADMAVLTGVVVDYDDPEESWRDAWEHDPVGEKPEESFEIDSGDDEPPSDLEDLGNALIEAFNKGQEENREVLQKEIETLRTMVSDLASRTPLGEISVSTLRRLLATGLRYDENAVSAEERVVVERFVGP